MKEAVKVGKVEPVITAGAGADPAPAPAPPYVGTGGREGRVGAASVG